MKNPRERGAVLIEFAIIAPLLVLLILGILEFGFRYQRGAVISNAAYIAARTASLSPHDATSKSRAQTAAQNAAGPGVTMSFVWDTTPANDPTTCTTGNNVTVTVTSTANSPTKVVPNQQTFTINAKGVARCDG